MTVLSVQTTLTTVRRSVAQYMQCFFDHNDSSDGRRLFASTYRWPDWQTGKHTSTIHQPLVASHTIVTGTLHWIWHSAGFHTAAWKGHASKSSAPAGNLITCVPVSLCQKPRNARQNINQWPQQWTATAQKRTPALCSLFRVGREGHREGRKLSRRDESRPRMDQVVS